MKYPRIIAICGYKQSGKDSIANVLMEKYKYVRVALADPIKRMARNIDPWIPIDGHDFPEMWIKYGEMARLSRIVDDYGDVVSKEVPEIRRFYQRLGTEGAWDLFGQDVWVDTLLRFISPVTDDSKFVIPDMRHPHEADAFSMVGAVLWRVYRPGTGINLSHTSESEIDKIKVDTIIDNDGTLDDLAASVKMMMKKY